MRFYANFYKFQKVHTIKQITNFIDVKSTNTYEYIILN